ncbi:MAG TPA: Glu-tRNA(Gln) amidotransferase subunit GatE [Candidatus Omnitrophota bacterium]|nr:Glu-tRNA(Gln) amidotransferase subunit GatE [Candidatus Omnitrophota bacterium]
MAEDKDDKALDYKKLKFKCGLEIHQQLNPEKGKLFCDCPSVLRQDEPDYTVERKLHAIAGEQGSVDLAVQYQSSLNKGFVYQGYKDSNCLVELDEEPPHLINEDALKTALHIALLFNMTIIPITQIMRKTVIDGSNTSGFQRTNLIARDGFVETDEGKFGVKFLYLEEDAARIISREKGKDVYRLDRLGIPLVEVVTEPDIKTPKQAQKVALKIGEILRSCKVKRGLGTIRQDVSVSINNGNRVEIKGAQDIDLLPTIVENEIKRQMNEKNVKAEVRNALPDGKTEFMRPLPGAARMYPETDLPLLKISRDMINEAKKTLPKTKEENEKELKDFGLHHEMIKLILAENRIEEFKELMNIMKNPELIAKMITLWRNELASRFKKDMGDIETAINTDVLEEILKGVKSGKINENNVKNIFNELMNGISIEDAISKKPEISDNIEEKIINLIHEKPGLSANAYMGLAMKEFHGKIDGKTAMEIIRKYAK